MENNSNDDYRKKRDSTDVVEGEAAKCEEKTKKLRAAKQRPLPGAAGVVADDVPGVMSKGSALDLELSLRHLVQIGESDCPSNREYLSKNYWVQFRVGNAGDVSSIAACYRQFKSPNCHLESNRDCTKTLSSAIHTEDTSLEIRLAEGLGDEDSPPSIFALLADVTNDKDCDRKLGAVALISYGWVDFTSVLRLDFFYIIKDVQFSDISNLLERRMWLRISTLALMTCNEIVVASEYQRSSNAEKL